MPATARVLATRTFPADVEARLRRDYAATLNPTDALYSREALLAAVEGHDALMIMGSEKLDAAAIAALPASVRVVASYGVGYEHIDVAAAKARGLNVSNTPDVLTDATADIAMLLVLGVARRAYEGQAALRAGAWTSTSCVWNLGRDLKGKRLGIVGMGRIGRALAQRARAFGMEIGYHNRHRLPAALEAGATYYADADAMLGTCDFLSLNFPATAETRAWLDARRIARLPATAFVINTARGAVVDEEALIDALTNGRLAGAGLDVYEGEPDHIRTEFRSLRNAYLLPHLGSATVETRNAMGFKCLDNLDAFFAGRALPDRVA